MNKWTVHPYQVEVLLTFGTGVEPPDYPVICELDHRPEIYEKVKDQTYIVCALDLDRHRAYAKPFTPCEVDTENTDDWICPYCGHVDHEAWELETGEGETYCGNCGETVRYVKEVYYVYSTYKTTEER